MSLSVEPSNPSERDSRHLPQKSYADAVLEEFPARTQGDRPALKKDSDEDILIVKPPQDGYSSSQDRKAEETSSTVLHGSTTATSRGIEKDVRRNGVEAQVLKDEGSIVIVEKYVDAQGEHLMSIKPAEEDDKEEKAIRVELVSGRKAGAGWERSG
jgi:hypothetical protein